jgi:hypothetical protein
MKQLKMWVATLWILSALVVTGSWSGQPVRAAELAESACRLAAIHGSYEFVAPAAVNVGQGTVIAIPDHLLYASFPDMRLGTRAMNLCRLGRAGYGSIIISISALDDEPSSAMGPLTIAPVNEGGT